MTQTVSAKNDILNDVTLIEALMVEMRYRKGHVFSLVGNTTGYLFKL